MNCCTQLDEVLHLHVPRLLNFKVIDQRSTSRGFFGVFLCAWCCGYPRIVLSLEQGLRLTSVRSTYRPCCCLSIVDAVPGRQTKLVICTALCTNTHSSLNIINNIYNTYNFYSPNNQWLKYKFGGGELLFWPGPPVGSYGPPLGGLGPLVDGRGPLVPD